MMMAGLDIRAGGGDWKEIGVWHLPATHLPERLLLIAYPHLSRDKNELEREEESSLSQFSQPRGEISGMCCTLTPGWLHSLDAALISWMRRDKEEGGGEQCVIEREEAGVKVCEIIFPPLNESDNLKLFSLGISTCIATTPLCRQPWPN